MNGLNFDITFHNTAEGLLVTDSEGKISHLNPSIEFMFGYDKTELLGKEIEMLIPDAARQKHIHNRASFMKNPHPRAMGKGMNLNARKKDGTVFPVEISLSPVIFEDKTFVLAFVVDVSDKVEKARVLEIMNANLEKEVEKRTLFLQEAVSELERTKQELNEALENEKHINDMKTSFVSTVSHEFRTPLATILSSLDLMEQYVEQNDIEKQRKHFNRIRNTIEGLTEILNDVLRLGRLDEMKVEVSKKVFDLKQFIEETIEEINGLLKKGQRLQFDCNGKSCDINTDRNILRHILCNLISNAIKFSAEGTVISLSADVKENYFIFSIQDHGIAISKEDQKKLFTRFFRGNNANAIQGTGLGLHIVQKYLDLLGGKIECKSQLNKGTQFILTVPLNVDENKAQVSHG